MKNKANQLTPTATQSGANFAELNIEDARLITGGTNPPPAGVVAGPNGEGCTGPFWPFPRPTPTFPYPIVITGPGW